MQKRISMLAALISAGLFVGCEKPAETPAAPAKPAAPAEPAPAPEAVKAPEVPTASEVKAPEVTPPAVTETPAPAAAAEADATSKATDLLAQVTQYVKENKMDLAEKALKQLDGMKGSLPASFQGQIENAHKMFDTAKKTQGLKDVGGSLLGK